MLTLLKSQKFCWTCICFLSANAGFPFSGAHSAQITPTIVLVNKSIESPLRDHCSWFPRTLSALPDSLELLYHKPRKQLSERIWRSLMSHSAKYSCVPGKMTYKGCELGDASNYAFHFSYFESEWKMFWRSVNAVLNDLNKDVMYSWNHAALDWIHRSFALIRNTSSSNN